MSLRLFASSSIFCFLLPLTTFASQDHHKLCEAREHLRLGMSIKVFEQTLDKEYRHPKMIAMTRRWNNRGFIYSVTSIGNTVIDYYAPKFYQPNPINGNKFSQLAKNNELTLQKAKQLLGQVEEHGKYFAYQIDGDKLSINTDDHERITSWRGTKVCKHHQVARHINEDKKKKTNKKT